ncbi:hypothetical protein BDV28DRAFT_149619 [Aspergillus coremiiformis]|uniref:Uncharacterized protein n=1 Tax=Aspergillus coremiiformis TaxID=138285 RepID=A0A5N6Z2D6_9EURO|nr:hypothetical protein BDV28DRAFT_149619 [Aspergillus coremiiformis]
MGALKILLKAILIPIVLLLVISVVAVFLIKKRRGRKEKERSLESGFKPPPIVQWDTERLSIQVAPTRTKSYLGGPC